jgi:tetratricopeptide (TPR) repeat protein
MKNFFDSYRDKRLSRKGQKLLAQGKVEKAFQLFQQAVLKDESPDLLFNLALSLMGLSRFAEAENYLTKLQVGFPKNELNTLTLAECMMMQSKWDEAKLLYSNLILINAREERYDEYLKIVDDPVIRDKYVIAKKHLRKATIELQKKNDEKALELLLEAEEYIPDNSNILNNIGSVYMLGKNYEKAYQYFIKALAHDQQNQQIKKNLILARRKLKK